MPEDGGLIGQALIGLKPVNAWVHTYTKSQTPSTRSRGLGWRIHESVEDTKLSTNKQHTLSSALTPPRFCELFAPLLLGWLADSMLRLAAGSSVVAPLGLSTSGSKPAPPSMTAGKSGLRVPP